LEILSKFLARWAAPRLTPEKTVSGAFLHEPELGGLSQTDTVLRSLEELRNLGVYLHAHAVEETNHHPVKYVAESDEFILATVGKNWKSSKIESILSAKLPTFLIVRGAAGSFGRTVHKLLNDDRVTCVIKNTNLADLSLNNDVSDDVKNRFHTQLIQYDDQKIVFEKRKPAIDIRCFEKLLTGYTIATYPRSDRVAALKWKTGKKRPYDISFVGKTNYGTDQLSRHRRRAVEVLGGLEGSGFNVHCAVTKTKEVKDYSKKRFYQVMLDSKIVLSPWGYGEVCIRDFEAMLTGAVVIKPDMSHLVTNPTVYIPNKTYLPCRQDFSDVPEIVERVVNDWRQYDGMRVFASKLIRNSRKQANVAALIASLIHRGFELYGSAKNNNLAIRSKDAIAQIDPG